MNWRNRRESVSIHDAKASRFVAEQTGELTLKIGRKLKSNYNQKELESLSNFWGTEIYQVLNNIGMSYLRKIYVLVDTDFKELPLYINEQGRFTSLFIKWRLSIGK